MAGIKARLVQHAVLEGTDAASVLAALDAWRAAAGEKTLLETHLAGAGTTFIVLILYTAG